MIWVKTFAIIAVASLSWARLVPHIRIDDPEAPDFRRLVTRRSVVAVMAASAASTTVLWLVPTQDHWLWAPYLALGLPLVAIDLRTTFLPKRLNLLAIATMGAALVPLALADWRAAMGAGVGAVATFAFFYAAWRLSPTLGFGDVRLAVLIGAVSGQAGLSAWTTALLAGTLLGAAHGIGHALWARSRPERPRHFPFGPALWLGPLVAAVAVRLTAG